MKIKPYVYKLLHWGGVRISERNRAAVGGAGGALRAGAVIPLQHWCSPW